MHVIYDGVPRVGAATFYIKYTLAFQDVAAMFGVIYMLVAAPLAAFITGRCGPFQQLGSKSGKSFSPECFVGFMRI